MMCQQAQRCRHSPGRVRYPSFPVGSSVSSVGIDNGYLYIAAGSKFVIADLSNPSSPVIVSTLAGGGSDVLIKGTYAYLLSGGTGVVVIDISNKAAPRIVTKVRLAREKFALVRDH